MSQFDKNQFVARMPLLQYLNNQQVCWNDLELGVREFAKQSIVAAEMESHSAEELSKQQMLKKASPYQSWWRSAFELFSSRQFQISRVNYKASELGEKEFIELVNNGPAILDVSDWNLNAGDDGQNYRFPSKTLVLPQQKLCIYTQDKGELSFKSTQNIWNNKGDSAFLENKQGQQICAWSYGKDAHNHLTITRINFDGEEKGSEGDEFIEITNTGSHWLDISDWKVESQKHQSFTFPAQSSLAPYQTIRVYTNQVHHEFGGFSFSSKTAIWNNKGDTGILFDDIGKIVSQLTY